MSEQIMVASRDNRLDSIKGFLIILVVLGHLIGECGTGVISGKVWTFIYTFHMPLFVLVSGYLTKIKDDKNSFWKGIKKIAIPFAFFQVISLFLCVVNNKQIGLTTFIIPYWTLWYLVSLMLWRITLQFSPKFLLDSPVVYLSIAVVISILCGLIPHGRIMSIQRTLNFYPFFLLGFYMQTMGGVKCFVITS